MTFDHIALSTRDVAASIEFYRAKFPEVTVLYQDASWGIIETGGARIAFVVEAQHPPHVAFAVASREELELDSREAGAKIVTHRDHSKSFYQVDPSGNILEFIYYPPK